VFKTTWPWLPLRVDDDGRSRVRRIPRASLLVDAARRKARVCGRGDAHSHSAASSGVIVTPQHGCEREGRSLRRAPLPQPEVRSCEGGWPQRALPPPPTPQISTRKNTFFHWRQPWIRQPSPASPRSANQAAPIKYPPRLKTPDQEPPNLHPPPNES